MKIGKAPELLKKAAAMCKNKTSRLLILASLQRRRMAAVAVVSHKINTLIAADRKKVDCHKPLAMRTFEKRPVIVHESDLAANISHQLAMFSEDDGHGGGCPADWTLHPLFNDDQNNCCYTDDDDDMLLDVCNQDHDDELSVMDVIKSNRAVEGLEFNMEEEIDQAADMFIRRFRERLNKGL